MRFDWTDSFESQDGDHVPDDETYLNRTLSLLRQPARCTNKSSGFCTMGKLCTRMLTLPSRSTGECCWPTYVSDGKACHCTTSSAPFRLESRMLKAKVIETMLYGCVTWSPTRGPSRYNTQTSPPIAPPLHRMEEETERRPPHAVLRRRTRQDWI